MVIISEISKKYLDLLIEAVKCVDNEYIDIYTKRDEVEFIKHYERIFCYELYHQIRCLQKKLNLNDYVIWGEPLKSYFKYIKDGKMPDFLFHKPKTEDNLIIVEVKMVESLNSGVDDDFKKIENYLENNNYKIGVFICIGLSADETREKIKNKLKDKYNEFYGKDVFLICRNNSETCCERLNPKEIIKCQD